MASLGRTWILASGLGWGALVGLLMATAPLSSAWAELRAPVEGAPDAGGPALYDLPVSRANRVLLPLFDKWVVLILRDGSSAEGRLVDIRVAYVVLRSAAGKDRRIQRKDIAGGRLAAAPVRPRVTTEALEALKGRAVRLHKKDGTYLDGIVRSVSEQEVNLETSQGVVGVPLAGLARALAREPSPRPVSTAGKLAALIGRVVRITLTDDTRVQGVLREASEKEIRVEAETETHTLPIDRIKSFLVGQVQTRAVAGGGEGAPEGRSASPEDRRGAGGAERAAGRSILPHHYAGRTGRSKAEKDYRDLLARKYTRIRDNGARLRNWGIGLMVAGLVMDIVGTSIALSTKNRKAMQFGYSMVGLSSTVFLVGVVMAPWGQVRHFRGIDMLNHIFLTR